LRDRVLAAIELPALGIWLGALAGFAFVAAPVTFRIIAPVDVERFSTVIVGQLGILTTWGYVLGAIAFITELLQRAPGRAVLVAVAIALAFYHQHVVVQAMLGIADVTSPAYRALHGRSTQIYGAVVVLLLVTTVWAAASSRRP
jgi:hypothetical protein